jgi:4-alpha-glucanotransferase
VPPDAFSATGQDWGLPTYRWDRITETDFSWLRQRARRMAALYDGYRVDHLVGWYRTFGRPEAGDPFFNPNDEPTQTAQGEAVLRILLDSSAEIIARTWACTRLRAQSMSRMDVPGCKVLRWERDYNAAGHPFIDRHGSRALSRDDRHARHRNARRVVGQRGRGHADCCADAARPAPPDSPIPPNPGAP